MFDFAALLACFAALGIANAQWMEAGKIFKADAETCSRHAHLLDHYFDQTLTLAGLCEDSYSLQMDREDTKFKRFDGVRKVRRLVFRCCGAWHEEIAKV